MRAFFIGTILLLGAQHAVCTTTINVGGYLFPPFVEVNLKGPSGLTLDLIQLLNSQQSDFEFKFTLTSPKRRYLDFDRLAFDALFFESHQWGWEQADISASLIFLTGGEVFITKNTTDKSQQYFNNISSHSLVGILGYHYRFADYNSNESFLKKQFNIELVNSPSTIINQVLSGRAEIGIVTQSYLTKALTDHPQYKQQLLVSNKMDQVYGHTLLVRDNSPLTIELINSIIRKIQDNGMLDALLKSYGLNSLNKL
jgi:polar amino acid transport system substrate-binding protein